jgi:hypothetical protein
VIFRGKIAVPPKSTAQPTALLHANLPLIEVAEPWQLEALLADASVARLILTRLSDRVAIVAPGQLDALHARLRKLDYLPKTVAEAS